MFSTAEIDEREAEAHLQQAYRVAGLQTPPICWFDSPSAFVQALCPSGRWQLEQDRVEKGVRDTMIASVQDRVQARKRPGTWPSVWTALLALAVAEVLLSVVVVVVTAVLLGVAPGVERSSVLNVWFTIWSWVWVLAVGFTWHIVWIRVRERLLIQARVRMWNGVRASVAGSVAGNLWHVLDNMREAIARGSGQDTVWTTARESVQAYADAGRLALYRFLHEVFEPNHLIHLARFTEMVAGYRLGSKQAWVVRKPIRLQRDEQGLLHSASGKCIDYRDGWGFYAWHGVRVPEKLILHPDQLTKEDWLEEDHLEVRRVMQERLALIVSWNWSVGGVSIKVREVP